MKTAFSLLLQEYVNPVELDYEDCRAFQIVCPVCKEPVFKVSRRIADKATDYFSHYRKDETLNEQCELRVRRIATERIEETRSESRNQKLRLFLKVFQDIVWENEYNEISIKKAKQRFFQLSRSRVFSTLSQPILRWYRNVAKDKNEIFGLFDETLENLYKNLDDFRSNFALNLQMDFAYDFFQHLLAGHSKANFFFLLDHGYILLLEKLERKNKNSELPSWEQAMLDYLCRFLKTQNEKKRMSIMNRMGEYKMISPYTHQEADLFIMFGSQLSYHAFGILLRIPYLEILRKQLKERTPELHKNTADQIQ